MFDGIQAWLNLPAPIFYFLVFAWILWSSARRLDKRIAKIETDKDKADSDAWWAKWEEGPYEYRQVYSNSVRKEWDRRLGEAKIAKFAHDWGFRALGRDRPYTVPVGPKDEAVFLRSEAWFAVLPDGTTSRDTLSAKQKSDLHGAAAWHERAALIGPIRASEQVDWPYDWYDQETRDWKAQGDEEEAVKRVAEFARDWGFSFLWRGTKTLEGGDECHWCALPPGGIPYETKVGPVSAEQSDKLDEIPTANRLHGFIAAAAPKEDARMRGKFRRAMKRIVHAPRWLYDPV
jgi:hypothetical protein